MEGLTSDGTVFKLKNKGYTNGLLITRKRGVFEQPVLLCALNFDNRNDLLVTHFEGFPTRPVSSARKCVFPENPVVSERLI